MSQDKSYPLQWPAGWPRTLIPQRNSKFASRTVSQALAGLIEELDRLAAQAVVISSNVTLGRDKPKDRGVCLYFVMKGKTYALPCDRWDRVEDNLWALTKHVEALRGQDRWGVGTLDQAFAGYLALTDGSKHWTIVLGLNQRASKAQITERYRDLAHQHHPDKGGEPAIMAAITAARDQALKEAIA